jgi:MazG family protein
MSEDNPFAALCALAARLRAPDGCPWDREQTLESLKTYIIEEAYEVVDAITDSGSPMLVGELGDLLFQIVFAAQIATERGLFDIDDVCRGIHAKMVRRHPHVFGDVEVQSASDVVRNWEAIKANEPRDGGALGGVPRHLPALLKALRITEKAAALGFDWERTVDVVAKLEEEVGELKEQLTAGRDAGSQTGVREELGDVLFVMANLARQIGVDPEAALQGANGKFARRFAAMEDEAQRRGVHLAALGAAQLDALWNQVKAAERTNTE